MRNLLTAVLLASILLAPLAPAAAAGDPLDLLRQAEYIDGHDVHASLPHGDFVIVDGVVCSLPGIDRRWGGMLIGDVEMEINNLPEGPGVLNLFEEMTPGFGNKMISIKQAYLIGSYFSGIVIEPSGYATAVRGWDELTADEREQFTSMYLQCYSDGFIEESGMGGGGAHWAGGGGAAAKPEVTLRDPRGQEVYAAIWDDKGQRFDYRVNEDGSEVTIKDYYRGVMMYQYPWAPEEGEVDENVAFPSIDYFYELYPADAEGEPDSVRVDVFATFTLDEDSAQTSFISAPWMEWADLELYTDDAELPYDVARGGEGYSDWMLFIDGPLEAGLVYELRLSGTFDVPRVFSALGYGGVYRFDTTPLWPGENRMANQSLTVTLPGNDWEALASGGADLYGADDELDPTVLYAEWTDNTRNQMIAATKFPMRELENDWGTLEVFAPAELIDTVDQTEYVAGVGDMMEYFTSLWGDWRGPGAGTDRQVVFLLPDETGVQAFEDAGFVFILGGSRTGIPLVAHEVTHLWWGQGFSGPRWFQEGMANYGAAKFLEHYRNENGIDDPLFYRRYIMNFSLGHELPLSMDRRDELDDSAAIYHNSAGFLLTADARLPYGFDGILKRIYEAGLWMPYVDYEELRGIFGDQSEQLGQLWDIYIEQGIIEIADAEDPTYRELVHTPERDQYVKMLNWLTPAYMKSAIGDYYGAIYCAERALDYRSEPKDYYFIADLTYKAGRLDEALERATVLAEREDIDPATAVKNTYLFARIYRDMGDPVNEQAALEYVVENGPAANVMFEVREAQQRLDELNAD